ncbi:histidine kinase [Nonomuraea sp. NPDC049695]|uniref:sensor histidine kinase n=1 Tax=Nonomuraea sp. NPDC049695 TaxID=3154734 RepID=UPI00342A3D09
MMRRHRLAVDVAIAVALAVLDTVLTLAQGSWWPERPGTLAWVLLGAQALACLSLAARRRAPLAVLAVIGAFTLVVTLLIWPLGAITPANPDNVWAPGLAASLAAYGPLYHCRQNRRRAIIALAVFTLIVVRPWQPSVLLLTLGVLRVALGPLLALYFDARRRLVQALTERAERAERERHLLAEQARTEERARLAGEMHDVVTHRVSLMVLQAGALRMTATDEETRRQAEELRVAGVQALDELRDLVGILRTAPEGEETPSVAGFAALMAESTAVGNPAELVEEGDPALASPVVGRTAYRIVREGLTNVRKHAPGARVTVRVEYGDAQVRLSIRNTPPTRAPGELAGTGSGLGIAGLRQRIEVVHGTLRAGREPDGGFRLEATLPAYVPTGV